MGKQLNKNRFDFYQLDRRKEEKVNKKGKINENCLIWISLVEEKEEKVKKKEKIMLGQYSNSGPPERRSALEPVC